MIPRLSGQNGDGSSTSSPGFQQDLADDAQAGGRARHDLDELSIERFFVPAIDVVEEGVDQARLPVNWRVPMEAGMLGAQLVLRAGRSDRVAVGVADVQAVDFVAVGKRTLFEVAVHSR